MPRRNDPNPMALGLISSLKSARWTATNVVVIVNQDDDAGERLTLDFVSRTAAMGPSADHKSRSLRSRYAHRLNSPGVMWKRFLNSWSMAAVLLKPDLSAVS